ncbi:MAG TPA: bifunctional 2-polyprenyl-6-hydroxyphenol methylase/3-demethylubiquinol 3-O-methyltransferase UbiG [Rhizomicrobium sp.]|jgi:2-polyprenyl-6-hydroxyphenyl methylase/3-demethylubiquinone-9 3-methyltransferase|nr:bifunctional 2-polyprenyl-6-hydroxyphenol methylase/3-demethylubiquinol 3-O-methyltransferase UbiG [Rhizomicrobium sp.]
MPRAQRQSRTPSARPPTSSIDAPEVAKFAALAEEWWDPAGKFAPLHRLNPVRLGFVRDHAARHFHRDPRALAPFAGLSLIDIGCGGGLLAEPLAKQGFAILGIDAAEENIAVASTHAQGLDARLAFRCAAAETIAAEGCSFDVVLIMETVEHVANRAAFLESCAALLNPGGLLFAATLNRTLKSLALAKFGAEYVLGWIPRGTHDWNKFVPPAVLRSELEDARLEMLRTQGVGFDPLAWDWRLSSDTDVNYMMVATKEKTNSQRGGRGGCARQQGRKFRPKRAKTIC